MAAAFAIYSLWPLWRREQPRWWALAIAASFTLLGWLAPKVLAPLNRVWLAFGKLISKVTSPIVLGLVYFGVFTPMAFLLRRMGKDLLRLSGVERSSYWIDRTPPGPDPKTIVNQF